MPALFIASHTKAALIVDFTRVDRAVVQIHTCTKPLHGGKMMAVKLVVYFGAGGRACGARLRGGQELKSIVLSHEAVCGSLFSESSGQNTRAMSVIQIQAAVSASQGRYMPLNPEMNLFSSLYY